MPSLRSLEAWLLRHNVVDGSHSRILTLENADGVMFLCPKCLATNSGSKIGVHSIICWFEGRVSDELVPKPGRWTPSGKGLEDLTFVPGIKHTSVSVLLIGGCGWHGFVKNGNAD